MHAIALALLLDIACGTSAEMQQRAEELTRFVDARRPRQLVTPNAPPTTRFANEFLYVRADDETAPFDDPADLEGMSLYFARRNDSTFAVTRNALQYDENIGPLFVDFDRGTTVKALQLPFAFPIGSGAFDHVTLSVTRGIHFTDAPVLATQPFGSFEMLTSATPLLSPLLDYSLSPGGRPNVYVKQNSGAVTITWRAQVPSHIDFDLQAVLFANGDVRYSYRKLRNFAWGGVVVNTGNTSWLSERTPLMTASDPADDVEPLYGASREMLDIREVSISRVANSSMLELRIKTGAVIDPTVLRDGSSYLIYLGDSLNRAELIVFKDSLSYRLPNLPEITGSPAAKLEGTDVVMYVPEELFALQGRTMTVHAFSNSFSVADTFVSTVDLGAPAPPAEVDFSEVNALETARPLVETYHLPTVNVYGVWKRLQDEFGYRDDEIDAVAIYTNFLSDIILTRFGAYATFANPGADGISSHSSKDLPRAPTLMHMNALGVEGTHRRTDVLLHELGHRWLYNFELRDESGARRRLLNPAGAHPAAWVHMPGAFGGAAPQASSPMGGGMFTDNHNGTFTTVGDPSIDAYSWHELYLMGLARAEEVQPWWYLSGTTLEDEYYPGANVTVNAVRHDLGVQNIIDAMGPRDPAYPNSQKEFRVLFVALERAGAPANVTETFRTDFEPAFATATGGRGKVITTLSLAPPVANFQFDHGQFTDLSTNTPLEWTWTFPDGTTSHARNPRKSLPVGTHQITLTVRNGKGEASMTKSVTVTGSGKRRSAGH
jgi:hypothetical protein